MGYNFYGDGINMIIVVVVVVLVQVLLHMTGHE